MIKSLLAFLALGLATPVLAQTAPVVLPAPAPTPAAPKPKPATVRVMLTTDAGPMVWEVEMERTPITAANFLRYVDQKRLDGTTFYRSVGEADYGFIQGGAQNDPKRVLKPIAHEPTTKTGLTHDDGAISMARNEPGSALADFFVVLGKMPAMDAHPEAPGDNQGFAVFGHVVEGLDVVKTIQAGAKSPTQGEGVMKGQILAVPVKILTARRVP